METKILDNIALNISARRIFLRSGYSSAAEIPADEEALLTRLLPKMKALLSPKLVLGELDVLEHSPDRLLLAGDVNVVSASVAKLMLGAVRVTLYAATIGSAVEDEGSKSADSGRYREALLWDSFGSEAAEALARHLSSLVQQRAKAVGLTNTARFSPGYGDLPLQFSKILLELLDARRIGIETNPEGLLIPRKSTTGLVGWVPIRDDDNERS